MEIKYYRNSKGESPFLDWLENLSDQAARAKIKIYVDRLARNNFGNCRSVGNGVHELKINFGPGYRVYFGCVGGQVVVLLCGGSKRSQARDIESAKSYWDFLKE